MSWDPVDNDNISWPANVAPFLGSDTQGIQQIVAAHNAFKNLAGMNTVWPDFSLSAAPVRVNGNAFPTLTNRINNLRNRLMYDSFTFSFRTSGLMDRMEPTQLRQSLEGLEVRDPVWFAGNCVGRSLDAMFPLGTENILGFNNGNVILPTMGRYYVYPVHETIKYFSGISMWDSNYRGIFDFDSVMFYPNYPTASTYAVLYPNGTGSEFTLIVDGVHFVAVGALTRRIGNRIVMPGYVGIYNYFFNDPPPRIWGVAVSDNGGVSWTITPLGNPDINFSNRAIIRFLVSPGLIRMMVTDYGWVQYMFESTNSGSTWTTTEYDPYTSKNSAPTYSFNLGGSTFVGIKTVSNVSRAVITYNEWDSYSVTSYASDMSYDRQNGKLYISVYDTNRYVLKESVNGITWTVRKDPWPTSFAPWRRDFVWW